jgi:hypothetical protein
VLWLLHVAESKGQRNGHFKCGGNAIIRINFFRCCRLSIIEHICHYSIEPNAENFVFRPQVTPNLIEANGRIHLSVHPPIPLCVQMDLIAIDFIKHNVNAVHYSMNDDRCNTNSSIPLPPPIIMCQML